VPETVYAVIPAGGAGSRLWPRSRRTSPKHVLPLSGSGTPLVRETFERIAPLAAEVFLLTEERQLAQISALLPELDREHLIVEPAARGTAAALGLAAMTLLERDKDAVMLSQPADHVIRGLPAYRRAVRSAAALAERSKSLITVGLRPRYPATGFGYLEAGEAVRAGRRQAFRVRRFEEKPDLATARGYVSSGRHYWNLAMFCWRADVFVEELARHSPVHARGLRRVLEARRRGDEAAAARHPMKTEAEQRYFHPDGAVADW